MTGAQALTMLMARMNRTNATLRANALLEMIQFQKMTLEKGAIMPDFLITRDASVTLTAANRQFTLPTDFLRELDEDETLWILDDDNIYHHMEKMDYEDGIDKWGSDATGDLPIDYNLTGLYGYTFPTPTVNRTLKMDYYATGGTIADDTVETVWLKHASDLIIGGTGAIVNALYVKDTEAAVMFSAMESAARKRLDDEQTARQEAGRSRRMG